MSPATIHQHTNLFIDQMFSNTRLETIPTELSISVPQQPDAFESSAILNITPISVTNLIIPEKGSFYNTRLGIINLNKYKA